MCTNSQPLTNNCCAISLTSEPVLCREFLGGIKKWDVRLDGWSCADMMCLGILFVSIRAASITPFLFSSVRVVCVDCSLPQACFSKKQGASGASVKQRKKCEPLSRKHRNALIDCDDLVQTRSLYWKCQKQISYFVCGQIVPIDIYRNVCSVDTNFFYSFFFIMKFCQQSGQSWLQDINRDVIGLTWNAVYPFGKGFFHSGIQNDCFF